MVGLSAFLLTACNLFHRPDKPDINGWETGQPIMDGWTYEQAGEYWLQSALDEERGNFIRGERQWMTPEKLADYDDVNIQVHLPLAPEGTNPQPLNDVTYRQAESDGFITFHLKTEAELRADSVLTGALRSSNLALEKALTIGTAEVWLKEMMYFDLDTTLACYVQQRGRGIYTLYYVADRGTHSYPLGHLQSLAAVIAVHPGADSITICRGNFLGPSYQAEKKK